MKERKKHLKVYEVFRDNYEQVVGMEEFSPQLKNEVTVEVPLLDAFVQGFHLAFRTRFN